MTDDLHYVPGDFYRICDRTGFKVRASRTKKEWTGRIVRGEQWERRHPQDFVTGVRDDQTVPDPRPRQIDVFLGPLVTKLTADAAAGVTTLTVDSSVRMLIGDTVTVMLDDGTLFRTNITNVVDPVTITIFLSLPFKASSGNEVIDTTAVATANIG